MSEIPVRLLKGPERAGVAIPKALNTLILNPSNTSQNAFGNVPLLEEVIVSVTSSLPKVLLSTQKERIPRGNGLSRFPVVIVAVPGNAVSTSCLKNGNGSALSPVRFRYTPPSVGAPAATIWLIVNPSCANRYQMKSVAHPVIASGPSSVRL